MLNANEFEAKWNRVRGRFREKYPQISDDHLTYSEGKFNEMLGRVSKQLGKSEEELREEIEKW